MWNVLRNLINLGAQTSIISFVGADQAGKKIKQDLKKKVFKLTFS